jgi:hypothetical protein
VPSRHEPERDGRVRRESGRTQYPGPSGWVPGAGLVLGCRLIEYRLRLGSPFEVSGRHNHRSGIVISSFRIKRDADHLVKSQTARSLSTPSLPFDA